MKVCRCSHGEALHDLHPKTGKRGACSVTVGDRGVHCGCAVFTFSEYWTQERRWQRKSAP